MNGCLWSLVVRLGWQGVASFSLETSLFTRWLVADDSLTLEERVMVVMVVVVLLGQTESE